MTESVQPAEGHDEWFRQKVEEGRKEVREHPDRLIPLEEIEKKYDL